MKRSRPFSEQGQDLVEYALLLPLFLILVMGIMDMGRAVYYSSALHNAARDSARYGIIHPDDLAGIENRAKSMAVGINPDDISVVRTFPDENSIRVSLYYTFKPITPIVTALLPSDEITIGSQAIMQIEQ